MFEYDAVSPPVSGWLEISLEQEIIDYLWKIERESRFPGTSVKNTLAGNITESRSLKDTDDYFLKNVLLDCVRNYKEEFPYTIRKPDTISDGNLTLNGFWVNYQKQHEFNPMHDHGGAYSFVIWMKIPTKSQEQHNLGFLRGMKNACASNFEMTYLYAGLGIAMLSGIAAMMQVGNNINSLIPLSVLKLKISISKPSGYVGGLLFDK